MIIKSYVALQLISTVDNQFVNCLPEAVKDNLESLNAEKELRLSYDHNPTIELLQQMRELMRTRPNWDRKHTNLTNAEKFEQFCLIVANLFVNLFSWVLINLHIILFNYFSPFLGLVIQGIGLYA